MLFPVLPSPLYFSCVIHYGFCKLGISLISQRLFPNSQRMILQLRFSNTLRPSLNFSDLVSSSQLLPHLVFDLMHHNKRRIIDATTARQR